jgi:hypothetical protein
MTATGPTKYVLLKTQKNDVVEAITDRGLVPSDFDFVLQRSDRSDKKHLVETLVHKSTQLYFKFDFHPSGNEIWATFSPGTEGQPKEVITSRNWDAQYEAFQRWLRQVKREVDAPDLWASLTRQPRLVELGASNETSNDRFNSEDRERLVKALGEMREEVGKLYTLNPVEAETIANRFNYLEDKLDEFGKKDWLNLALGVFANIALGIAFSTGGSSQQAGSIFRFLISHLDKLFQGIFYLR